MDYKTTVLKVSVTYRDSNPVFGEGTTHIELDDEGAGAFILLSQTSSTDGKLKLDMEELELIVDTAKKMIADYTTGEENENSK